MKTWLLPYPWKIVGYFLAFIGVILAVVYLKYDFNLKMPVFAVFSSFLEIKMFVIIRTNVADDLILLLLITGFLFMVCSKEKKETETMDKIRANALFKAFISNTIFLLFSTLFIFGNGFLAILILNLISFSIFYLCFFNAMKRKIYE